MRARLGSWAPSLYVLALFVLATGAPGPTRSDQGYFAEEEYTEEPIDLVEGVSACPSDRVLRSRDTCRMAESSVECIRLHCCDTHHYVAGRCIRKEVDPCSLSLCEQACEVRKDGVWCSCHLGYVFQEDNYNRKKQPFCVDVNECLVNNGGCDQRCVNDPGGFHCECMPPFALAPDERRCMPPLPPEIVQEPMPQPLVRASSRCLVSCETVARLSRRVTQLAEQLDSTQRTLHKFQVADNERLKDGNAQFAEGNFAYRVLDATAPLEGGYCRCERGPRGPPGPPGMDGPKGSEGARGPRGARGARASLDLMLLLLADLRHDIHNLETRVYKDGNVPERFNLQQAWRHQRKQEKAQRERHATQEVSEGYARAESPTERPEPSVQITPNGLNGEIPHEETKSTTDWSSWRSGSSSSEADELTPGSEETRQRLLQLRMLVNSTSAGAGDDDADLEDYDYTFY